jgi:hypothetical protein
MKNSADRDQMAPRGTERLIDRRIILREVQPSDYGFLYSLIAVPAIGLYWRTHGATPSPEEFRASLWNKTLVQFVAQNQQSGRICGLVGCYNANLRNGVGYLSALAAPSAIGSGDVIRGMALLISYLFANWPLRKLYFESPESSLDRFASLIGDVFREEGRLSEFLYSCPGRYEDVVIASVCEERWRKVVADFGSISSAAASRARHRIATELPDADDLGHSDGLLDFDAFVTLVSEILERDLSNDLDATVGEIAIDSLQCLELLSVIDELTGVIDETARVTVLSVRDLYAMYCTAASMPPAT